MANPEHLDILKKGVDYWNNWRAKNADIKLDLSKEDLKGVNFIGINLFGVDLYEADLREAKLSRANLQESNLIRAKLINANLCMSKLISADLFEADLNGAKLIDAKLSSANLNSTNLSMADLSNAILIDTNCSDTIFTEADLKESLLLSVIFRNSKLTNTKISGAHLAEASFINVDFSEIEGLSDVIHMGPSYIDISTLYLSQGKIPENFLRGAGVPEDFILNHLPSIGIKPIEFYSCFISYSHDDKSFARRLYDTLQMSGIRCWLDEKQMLPGDDIYERVDRGIRLWDKILLCASEHSLTSWWVDNEIRTAFDKEQKIMKERKKKIHALIPLNLDGYMFSDEWKSGYKQQVKERLAANFKGWEKDNALFESEVEKVIKALRTDRESLDIPPEKKL